MGVLEVFTPGAATSEIIDFVHKAINKKMKWKIYSRKEELIWKGYWNKGERNH
jgi:hypothetical protein